MRPFSISVSAVLALSLSACVSVLPEATSPDSLYRLGPMDATHALDHGTVSIRQPDAPRLYAGKAIASQGPDGSLRLVPGVEWSESATRMLQLGLLDTLGSSENGAAIAAGSGGRGAFELAWRLSDFTLAGTEARCRMELTLLDGTGAPISQSSVNETAIARSGDNGERAKAMAEAGRACVRRAADFLVDEIAEQQSKNEQASNPAT